MESFEELKSDWEQQPEVIPPKDGSKKILERISFLRNKQKVTYVVLGITMIILIGFFFYISAYRYDQVMLFLGIMIGAIFTRIAVEMVSVRKLKKLDRAMNMELFALKTMQYYKNRKRIHYVLTPLLILVYCWSFIGLLPYFKMSLSEGFYTYIQISGTIVLIGLGIFIGFHIKKELQLLKELQFAYTVDNKKQ